MVHTKLHSRVNGIIIFMGFYIAYTIYNFFFDLILVAFCAVPFWLSIPTTTTKCHDISIKLTIFLFVVVETLTNKHKIAITNKINKYKYFFII